jgi:hypothetical protein
MIKTKVRSTPTKPIEPPVSYPFLWKSESSGVTYLRFKSGANEPQDMVLIATGAARFGAITGPQYDEHTAWKWRLTSDVEVTLQNDN